MKKIFYTFLIIFISTNTFADFKVIKKKAKVINPEVIFPIPKNLKNCQKCIFRLIFYLRIKY